MINRKVILSVLLLVAILPGLSTFYIWDNRNDLMVIVKRHSVADFPTVGDYVVAWDSGATPIVMLRKADLCDNVAECLLSGKTRRYVFYEYISQKRFAGLDNISHQVMDYTKQLPDGKFDTIISALSIHQYNSGLTDRDIELWKERRKLDRECSVEKEVEMLHRCTFSDVKCLYSYHKFSVILAVK